jgi:hypothetical protein
MSSIVTKVRQCAFKRGATFPNALITEADIDLEDGPQVRFRFKIADLGGCDFGLPAEFVVPLMETIGVSKWSEIEGKPVRLVITDKIVRGVGSFIDDQFLIPTTIAESLLMKG